MNSGGGIRPVQVGSIWKAPCKVKDQDLVIRVLGEASLISVPDAQGVNRGKRPRELRAMGANWDEFAGQERARTMLP